MNRNPLGTLKAFLETMVPQSARHGLKLCCYVAALTVYPTEAWAHAVEALEELSMSVGAAKFAIYHAIVAWHIAHDANCLLRALSQYSGKARDALQLLRNAARDIHHSARAMCRPLLLNLLRIFVFVVATLVC